MKSFIFQILFLFLFSTCLLAQNNQGNFRSAIDSTEDAFMSNWQESSNLSDKLTVVVEYDFPTEFGFYLGQSKLEYKSIMLFAGVDVRYDNGNWITLLSGVGGTTGEFIPPWNTLGTHTMDIRYWDLAGNLHFINNIVYVIPPRDKIYYDGLGNWVSGWTGTTTSIDRPVIIIEGFDPLNLTWPDYYYGKAANWLNRIRGLDADVLIFNFNEGGTDLVANAHIIQEFARYIESITEGSEKIILAGLSMGGPIGRYALAEAEAQGIPLYVSHFLSIDSPQQDAIIPRDFLDYIKDNDEGTPHPELNSIAAKQMLRYDPYDPSNSYHTTFYNVLNSLNGDGYPHNCTNIGVSFAPNINNPNTGEWLEIETSIGPNKHFYLWEGNECLVPGSYLPLSGTRSQGTTWYVLFIHWNLVRKKNPTYIPYVSALDIVNGESKFDVTLNSSAFHYHDEFPDDLVDPVSNAIGLLEDSYNNVTFKNVIDNIQEDNVGGLLKVTDYSGAQTQVSSGGTVSVSTNQDNIVETLDRYRLNFNGNGINYQQKDWNKELSEYKVKHTFKGWHNDIQKAYFSKLDKVIVKNSLGGISLSIGNVDFKDPWYKIGESQPNEFQTFSSPFTPGDGTYASYGGVFLNQNPTFDPTLPVYSVKVNLTQDITLYNTGKESGRSHKFYFRDWDYDENKISLKTPGSNETAVVFKTSDAVLSANLKGTNLSDDTKAYNTTSQRKFVKTDDGWLLSTHSSMGRIWFESSSDNGVTWKIANIDEQPLDNGEGKLPSITNFINYSGGFYTRIAVIIFQEKFGSGFKIKAKCYKRYDDQIAYFYQNEVTIALYTSESYSNNANPVLAVDSDKYLTFIWEQKSSNAGLYQRNEYWDASGLSSTGSIIKINFTNSSSTNPSIAISSDKKRHLVWQAPGVVNSTDVLYGSFNRGGNLSLQNPSENISNGNGYPSNYSPCISLANGKPVVSWTGYYDGNIWKIIGEQESLTRSSIETLYVLFTCVDAGVSLLVN